MVSETSLPGTRSRRIVVCCDGTSNKPDRNYVTNIVKTARGIAPEDSNGVSQIVFYEWGVGTSGKLDAITGGAFGHGLGKNVESAYRFIVHNYQPGDQIYLLGFSRGAFTARSVAGLIRQCSILRKEKAHLIPEGYSLYRDPGVTPKDASSETWRSTNSHPMPLVEFIGVWDTVGALGIPANRILEAVKHWTYGKWFGGGTRKTKNRPAGMGALGRNRHAFHDMRLSRYVKNAFHALAIDERRPVFSPAIWDSELKDLPDGSGKKQVVKQAWFPGDHSDVGGNSKVHNSSISLKWIAEAAGKSGLEFTSQFWAEIDRDLGSLGPLSGSPPGPWKFAGSEMRDMSGSSAGTECIHPSARDREQNWSEGYAPENLQKSLLPDCT